MDIGHSAWMIENLTYVKNFLKFGFYAENLGQECENERKTSIGLLEEILRCMENKEMRQNCVYAHKSNDGVKSKHLSSGELSYSFPKKPGSGKIDEYTNGQVEIGDNRSCEMKSSFVEDDFYVPMNRNGLSGLMHEDTVNDNDGMYVNKSMINKARANSNPEHETHSPRDESKLFLSAHDIEERWRKLSACQSDEATVSADFERVALKTVDILKKQKTVNVRKNCFCFGYLLRRKKVLLGHKWENIYAIIKKNLMFLYKSEFDERATEVIVLNGYEVGEVEEKSGKAGFLLTPVDLERNKIQRPTHRFRCSLSEFEEWQQALALPKRPNTNDARREKAWLKIASVLDQTVNIEDCAQETSYPKNGAGDGCFIGHSQFDDSMHINGYAQNCKYRLPYPLPTQKI